MNTIQAGDVLKARSICDYDTVFEAEVLERKGRFVTVKAEGQTRRVMVMSDGEGEFIYAMGRYSMAPIFRALPSNAMAKIQELERLARETSDGDIWHDMENEVFWSLIGVAEYHAKAGGPEAKHAEWLVHQMTEIVARRSERKGAKVGDAA